MPAGCAVSFVSGQEPFRTGRLLSLPPGQHRCSLRWCPSRPGPMRGTLVMLWRGHCRLQVSANVCWQKMMGQLGYVTTLSCCGSQRMLQTGVCGFSVKPAATGSVRPGVVSYV